MTDIAEEVVAHYASGTLFERIEAGLAASGADPAAPTAAQLKPVDEFHIGGLVATDALLAQLEIGPADQVVDLGSGLGGTARHIHAQTGAKVQGFDLTPEFVEVARKLSALVGDPSTFEVGSILSLPIASESQDLATLFHVGMNIADKDALFAEVARVLKPGATFAIYDIMRQEDGALTYPVPWASTPSQSHLARPETYRSAAARAGFGIVAERDRGDFARDFFAQLQARVAESGPPPFSLAVTMGERAQEKMANMVANLKAGRIAPVELICRKA